MDKIDFCSITAFMLTLLAIVLHNYTDFASTIFWDLFIIIGTNIGVPNLIARVMYKEWIADDTSLVNKHNRKVVKII